MNTILSIDTLAKSYGPVQALRGVTFSVPQGSVFGILGPNGSGKTTLLAIVLDVLKADSGGYNWLGSATTAEARQQIGSLLETPNFYHYMSAWDNLQIAASIKGRGLEDRSRVLELTGLLPRKDSAFKTFSLGMKQRLAIASALLGRPKVLVLDEPTNGLDPAGIAEIRQLIRNLASEGITVIMASHLLNEVEQVCDHVAILKRGSLLLTGRVDEVMRSDDAVEIGLEESGDNMGTLLSGLPGVRAVRHVDGRWLLSVDDTTSPGRINKALAAQGIILSHLALKRKSLESMFMELTEDQSGAAKN